jgi:hypothetical protein
MQYKLPHDVKTQCLAIVQGYDRRYKWYLDERWKILNSSPSGYTTYIDNGIECRQYSPHVSGHITDEPYDKTIQLDRLEKHINVLYNHAVDEAKLCIGLDLPEGMRQKLTKAIMINCSYPRRYPYERLDVDDMERSTFYNHRTTFLYNIANSLQFV